MTERDWLTGRDPKPMLEFVRYLVGERQLRHFACACCRDIWNSLRDDARELVELVERSVVRPELEAQMQTNRITLRQDVRLKLRPGGDVVFVRADQACLGAADDDAFRGAMSASLNASVAVNEACTARRRIPNRHALQRQCDFLRDIVGNPWLRVTLDPVCATANDYAARHIAMSIHEDSDFDDLPILADALEDAGCSDSSLLSHLREFDSHIRGCWAVDLVLALE